METLAATSAETSTAASIETLTEASTETLTEASTTTSLSLLPCRRAINTATIALLLFLAPVAHAVQIPVYNCLSESYRLSNPPSLQWSPLYADASLNNINGAHVLTFAVWGNVSGSLTRETVPPSGSERWNDDADPIGKILGNPEPANPKPLLTTLVSTVNVLTYEPLRLASDFCNTSLVGAKCPLGPVFNTTELVLPGNLPSINMTHDFGSSHAFTSLSAAFTIRYGDSASTTIACISATITPDLGGDLAWMLRFLPLAIMIFVGFATIYAGMFSACGTTDLFHWSSNFGRQPDLLRLVTPGFGDCLQYIQFVVLTGALTLNYPGYYQPIAGQASWAALMFNSSLVSGDPPWTSLADGIYVTNAAAYGFESMGQLIGIPTAQDIWAGMMAWVLVLVASVTAVFQLGFVGKWLYRYIRNTAEQDLRSKNLPFSVGNVVRLGFNFFLLPIVALSTFQLVVAARSPAYVVALAVFAILCIAAFALYLFRLIVTTKPRVNLFDDLQTLLMFGPLYNTYSDEAAAYALVPLALTVLRGIAIGAVQPSGVAQVVILGICEVVQIFTIHSFHPFHSPTSMNAYHTLFAVVRFIAVMLMIAFVPSLGIGDGAKGWIGYVILFLHACVLVLGFFLNALQKCVEVTAYVMGVGATGSQVRPGFMRIFGARQLQRRMTRGRHHEVSRRSHLSSTGMLDADEQSRASYAMSAGRLRNSSAASLGGLLHSRQMSASMLDTSDAYSPMPGSAALTPGTPGATSTFSFPTSPPNRSFAPGVPMETADPYYRPPRVQRRELPGESAQTNKNRLSVASSRRYSQGGGPAELPEADVGLTRRGTRPGYGHSAVQFAPRTDYSTREVDFYYRVRGPALNSEGMGRKLGTGPADPTATMSSAAAWLRGLFGGKSKEKTKGFEVVRSSRMPPVMVRAAAAAAAAVAGQGGDETPPDGIPVALGVLRHGAIDSDSDSPGPVRKQGAAAQSGQLIDVSAEPRDSAEGQELLAGGNPDSPSRARGEDGSPSRHRNDSIQQAPTADSDGGDLPLPDIPRKSSRRHSGSADRMRHAGAFNLVSPPPRSTSLAHKQDRTPTRDSSVRHHPSYRSNPSGHSAGSSSLASRLPFERSASQQGGPSSTNSSVYEQPASHDRDDANANFGLVVRHNASLVDLDYEDGVGGVGFMSRSAEFVNEEGMHSDSRGTSLRR